MLLISLLIAGSIITYSSKIIVFLSFSIPAIVPLSLMLVAKGDKYHSFLGGVGVGYLLIMFIISLYMNYVFNECLKIELKNESLRARLIDTGINPDSVQ